MNATLLKKILAFFFAIGLGIFFIKVFNKRTDFPCFYLAGERFLDGGKLYFATDEWPYKYLPSAAVFFSPLSIFSQKIASMFFYIISFGSLVLTYLIIGKVLIDEKVKITFYSIVIVFFLNLKSHAYDFANLQINHITLLLLVLSFYIYSNFKSKVMPWAGGFIFSIAGIFKIIPLFIAGYFLLKKDFKYFLILITTTILVIMLPIAKYGLEGMISLLHDYRVLMGSFHQLFSNDRLYQSIPAAIARFAEYFNINNFNVLLSLLVIILVVPCVAAVKMIYDQHKFQLNDIKLNWLEFSFCLVFYPLVNPVGWKHSYVFLLPAIFLLYHFIIDSKLYLEWRYRISIAIFLLLYVFSSEMFIGKTLSKNKDYLSFNVFAALIVLYLIFITHKRLCNELNDKQNTN